MARKPTHTKFEDLLLYYINLYYVIRERNKGLLQSEGKHIDKIEKLDQDFRKELTKRYEEWDTPVNRPRLKQEIDFLTQVFTNQQKREDRKAELQALKDKVKSPRQAI